MLAADSLPAGSDSQSPPGKFAIARSTAGARSAGLLTVLQLLPFQWARTGLGRAPDVQPSAQASRADSAVTPARALGAGLAAAACGHAVGAAAAAEAVATAGPLAAVMPVAQNASEAAVRNWIPRFR